MLLTTVLWMTFEAWLWGLIPALIFGVLLFTETTGIALLIVVPFTTDASLLNLILLAPVYLLSLVLPRLVLWNYDKTILRIQFFPKVWRRADFIHVCVAIPLSVLGLFLYLTYASPEVVNNWDFSTVTTFLHFFLLGLGMYLLAFWDELFCQNTVLPIFDKLFGYPVAIVFSSTVFAAVMWDLAFRGWGFLATFIFAFSQGVLWRRSRSLFWVILVHFILEAALVFLIMRGHF